MVSSRRSGTHGTKYGCGAGQCGACTVHINGQAVRSCQIPVGHLDGEQVVTIEGLSPSADELHPVQQAWLEYDVPQCGYCQPGQIMAASALLEHNPQVTETDIKQQMTNLCRCGTYPRIKQAILSVSKKRHTGTEL